MASSEPSRKRGREEVPPPPPAEPEKVLPPPPAKPEEVPPPPPKEVPPPKPTELKPLPLEELKLPQRKVAWQPVAPVRAPSVNVQAATWSVKLLH
jgi:protein TonB